MISKGQCLHLNIKNRINYICIWYEFEQITNNCSNKIINYWFIYTGRFTAVLIVINPIKLPLTITCYDSFESSTISYYNYLFVFLSSSFNFKQYLIYGCKSIYIIWIISSLFFYKDTMDCTSLYIYGFWGPALFESDVTSFNTFLWKKYIWLNNINAKGEMNRRKKL